MSASRRSREEFFAVVAWELHNGARGDLQDALALARFLLRSEATLHRLAEEACNRELTPAEERREATLAQRVREACEGYGIGVTFNDDPRGAAIYLRLPSGRSNDWGGRGYAVP